MSTLEPQYSKALKVLSKTADTESTIDETIRQVSAALEQPKELSEEEKEEQKKLQCTIYVGNLNPIIQEEHLREFLKSVGRVKHFKFAGTVVKHLFAICVVFEVRYAFVEFDNVEEARTALNLNGQMLFDRQVKICPASSPIRNPDPPKWSGPPVLFPEATVSFDLCEN
ncbi:splicing factor, arginine/serine-rich 12 [Reticulomyxa filosa]|uniref:Splicing factor, arginine/serine-rich 12 n=1 Tax=Reticulomyxa filosa TaxID=46433 RepID=X6NMS7_RETFI|nr:splicing factor, arginine/serine-rich 12 [Reticulomyxa filosa]|eukprot:ETO27306.1 splicing factor, arginine/serine-rich 12 [Reticulomyxa filosa]